MRWTERQHQMLAAMGLRPWGPARAAQSSAPAVAPAPQRPPGAASAPVAVALRPMPEPQADVATSAPAPAPRSRPPVSAPARPAPSAPAPSPMVAAGAAAQATLDPARLARIASLDWDGLRQEVASCQACGLCSSRKQTVFGVGHPQAHWMVIGEAPGEQEDLQGEPFVGAAGQLLDQMLAAIGLSRSEGDAAQRVFIANTLKCRPPRNRNPDPAELSQCAPFLARQIELVRPRLILAMGRFAIQQLLATEEPVGRLRGRIHQAHGVPVVVTYHPAYLLRQPLEKAKAWVDLCLAAHTVENLPD